MAAADWTFQLVFEAPDRAFHVESRRYREDFPLALALARREGKSAAFGRTFHGFASLEPTQDTITAAPRPRTSPTNPARALTELLAARGLSDDGRVANETPRHEVPLAGLEAIPWWHFEGAFGMATEAGVALGRCASTDEKEAEAAAWTLGEIIAHQQQLFPVTAEALPFMVELISSPKVSCRAALAGWLQVAVTSATHANDAVSNLLAFAARLVARDQAKAMASHQRAAREVIGKVVELRPRLEALAPDPVVGARIRAMFGK
jgi:hypothetical protein